MTEINYFLQTLKHLRRYEEVMLYANLLEVTNQEEAEVIDYLRNEFET